MIRYRDTILENFFIDPETAVITNSKGEIQNRRCPLDKEIPAGFVKGKLKWKK